VSEGLKIKKIKTTALDFQRWMH